MKPQTTREIWRESVKGTDRRFCLARLGRPAWYDFCLLSPYHSLICIILANALTLVLLAALALSFGVPRFYRRRRYRSRHSIKYDVRLCFFCYSVSERTDYQRRVLSRVSSGEDNGVASSAFQSHGTGHPERWKSACSCQDCHSRGCGDDQGRRCGTIRCMYPISCAGPFLTISVYSSV